MCRKLPSDPAMAEALTKDRVKALGYVDDGRRRCSPRATKHCHVLASCRDQDSGAGGRDVSD